MKENQEIIGGGLPFPREKRTLRSIVWPTVILVVMAVITFFSYRYLVSQIISADTRDFAQGSDAIQNQLLERLNDTQWVVLSVKGLFLHAQVSRDDFSKFVDEAHFKDRFPELYSVRYFKYFKADQRVVFEKQMSKIYSEYRIYPEVGQREYAVVVYEKPLAEGESAIGFDGFSDSVRREAFERARDTGEVVMTGQFVLPNEKKQVFAAIAPIYKVGSILETVEERRQALDGFVAGIFDKDRFYSQLVSQFGMTGMDLEIFDGVLAFDHLLFDSNPARAEAMIETSQRRLSSAPFIDVLGRRLVLFFSYYPGRTVTWPQYQLPYLVLAAGSVFGMLLFFLFLSLNERQVRAEAIARQMTNDLLKFRLAVASADHHVIITDADGKIVYANEAVSKITGFSQEEIIGQTPRLWGGQMERSFYEQFWHRIKVEKKTYRGEIKNRRKNGQIYSSEVVISPILDSNGVVLGFVGLEDDITERLAMERALAEQARFLEEAKAKDEAVLASIGDGVLVMDKEGRILLVNQEALTMLGYEQNELLGAVYSEKLEVLDSAGNALSFETRPLVRALAKSERVSSGNYLYKRKDGRTFPVYITAAPVIRDGQLIGSVDVFHDITAEKAIDRAKTEFVSLASHQLRTPLSAVNWYTEMLLEGGLGAIDPNQKHYLEEIAGANKRMIELVSSLLNVSRIDLGTFAIEPKSVAIDELAKDVVAELMPEITFKKLDLVENYRAGLPEIQVDPKLTRMIIQNLLTNAVKYTPEKGRVALDINLVRSEDQEGGQKVGVDGILIKVADTGYGIPENQKAKIFQKLFRADNVKEKDTGGTGLGLYIVKSILDETDGKIWFESKENVGSTFYVVLPLSGMRRRVGERELGHAPSSRFF